MAWSHLIPNGLTQFSRVSSVVDWVILRNGIIPEREIRPVPKQAVDPSVLVPIAPRVTDKQIVGLHYGSWELMSCYPGRSISKLARLMMVSIITGCEGKSIIGTPAKRIFKEMR